MKIRDILALLGGVCSTETVLDQEVSRVTTLAKGAADAITFFNGHRYYLSYLYQTSAAIIIIGQKSEKYLKELDKPYILTDDPYIYFARLSQLFAPAVPYKAQTSYQHVSAEVAKTAEIGEGVYISAGVVIGENVSIGDHVYLGPGVVLMAGVQLGDGVVLHPHVVVYDGCSIGDRTIVHAGSVIGADGFGYARDVDRTWVKIMQVGYVRIGADCEIGACVTVDRGAIEDTVIGDGVKIDNQTQVGHNCILHDHVILSGHVSLAGSVRLGAYSRLGGAAGVLGPIDVPEGTDIAGASFLSKLEEGVQSYASCIPAVDSKRWFRRLAALDHLGKLSKKVEQLSEQVASFMNKQEETSDES